MRQILYLAVVIGVSSCVGYNNLDVIKTGTQSFALQSYYSPCCGACGQRIVTDDQEGKQYTLQVSCDFDDIYTRLCSPREIGTQKQVMTYRKKKITSVSYYRPVYDTVELKKLFPVIERATYFDSAAALKPVLPLTEMDSVLMRQYLSMTTNKECDEKHLALIRGFILDYSTSEFIYEKKKVKYKAPKKK